MFCSVYISNMASELSRIHVQENEVLLFKDGQPVLRVERGTTLSVIKLLYQADLRNKGTIIGLKPQTDDLLPCLLTLDQSPLELAKYEIIALAEPSLDDPSQSTRETIPTRSLPLEKSSNLSSSSFSTGPTGVGSSRTQLQAPGDAPQETSPGADQTGESVSHAVPLMVNISPEGHRKSLSNQGVSSISSSLLVARKDSFSSHSSVSSMSRRKKTARKTVFPRKISPSSSPSHSLSGKSIHEKRFQRGVATRSKNPILRSSLAGFEVAGELSQSMGPKQSVDSPGLCDSTETANLELSMEGTGIVDEEPALGSQPTINHNTNDQYSVEDSAGFTSFQSLESPSTNGSSPTISEGHPMVIDVSDSRETSAEENDSDVVSSESGSSPLQNHALVSQARICSTAKAASSDSSNKEGAHVDKGINHCTHTPMAIVMLENTVQVKTEPKEMVSPGSYLRDQNSEGAGLPFPVVHSDGESSASENHCQSERVSVMQPSSPLQQESGMLLPQVVSVVGASPDNEFTEEDHHHHHHDYSDEQLLGINRHNCNVCQKQFDSANSVMRHKRSHTGERPYICKICGWGFNLSGNLNQHLAIHQKVKPFKCVYCGKTFARSNVLKAHVRCHTGERPFQCQLCGSKFIIGHNLKKHMLTRHGIKDDDKGFSQNSVQNGDSRSQVSQNDDHSDSISIPMSQQ